MFVLFNTLFFIFIIHSKISYIFAAAHHEPADYEEDERNLIPDWTDLDSDKETRELLIRELLLNRFGRILEQQQQQQRHQPPFTYNFPPPRAEETFGVPPSDPRYYEIPNNNAGLQKGDERFLRHMKSDDVILNSDKKEDSGLLTGDNLEAGPNFVIDKNGNKDIDGRDDDLHISIANNLQAGDQQTAVLSMPAPLPLAVQVIKTPIGDFQATRDDMIFVAIVAGCSAAAVLIIAAIGFGWYRLHKKAKAAADVDYPAYGVTGPNKEVSPTGDRKLAESAQMYHYQHQKQQIISMSSSRASNENRGSGSEAESDEENEEGDYTVYECPGLAATGEMEVKNPLFQDDPTPANGNQNNAICPTSPAGDKSGDKSNQNQK